MTFAGGGATIIVGLFANGGHEQLFLIALAIDLRRYALTSIQKYPLLSSSPGKVVYEDRNWDKNRLPEALRRSSMTGRSGR